MKNLILSLIVGMTTLTVNAQSKIEPGTEEAYMLIQERTAVTCDPRTEVPSGITNRAKCAILNHTPYTNDSGVACVKCGKTYVSVTWYYDDFFFNTFYESSVVSNCNW